MAVRFWRITAAELTKLYGLPVVFITAICTVALGAVTWFLSVEATVPFVQVGFVLLGVLPAGHEGAQIRTTLTAVPNRLLLMAGKTTALLIVATAIGACLGRAFGAVAYLVLIALLSHAVAVLVRSLIPALVGMLSLLFIVSPLLQARWLPDRAGQQLYHATDPVLTPVTGGLVLLLWASLTLCIATTLFVTRDA